MKINGQTKELKIFQTNRNSIIDVYLGEKILLKIFKKWKYSLRYWMWL